MNVEYLIQLLRNRLNALSIAKEQAFLTGDLERINTLDAETLSVESTIGNLNLLLAADKAALSANTTTAQVVQSGIDAAESGNISYSFSSTCLNGYDMSSYATDPEYLNKLSVILEALPNFSSASDIDLYIKNLVPDSHIYGQMVWDACTQNNVDIYLVTTILQLESLFGTSGVGAYTSNPGNVGNTGSDTRNYNSWQEGVNAVAEWVSRHRAISSTENPIASHYTYPEETAIEEKIPVEEPVEEEEEETKIPDLETPTETVETPITQTSGEVIVIPEASIENKADVEVVTDMVE